jgi:hypothetical protein
VSSQSHFTIRDAIDGNVCGSDLTETIGDYDDEQDSSQAFKSAVNQAHWIVHQEVSGLLPYMGQRGGNNRVRIDFVLQPTSELVSAGWSFGLIGVECKRSGVKLGSVCNQAADYVNALWQLRCGTTAVLSHVFLWRCPTIAGNVLSMMINQRLGEANLTHHNTLRLVYGTTCAYVDNQNWGVPHVAKRLPGGNKKGSR